MGPAEPAPLTGPVRTCVGCRRKAPQPSLIRVARSSDGRLTLSRTAPGRGAWLCADSLPACLERAVRRKALARAFRAPISEAAATELRRAVESAVRTCET